MPTSTLSRRIASARSNQPPHLMIIARAGTGKTTTLVEGLKHLRGQKVAITPSEQQEAIWDQLKLSQGCGSVCFTAFNTSIAKELSRRVPKGVDAKTMHGLGYQAVRKFFDLPKDGVEGNKTMYILRDVLKKPLEDIDPVISTAVRSLVGLCKANLADLDEESLYDLAVNYEVELNSSAGTIFELTREVLELSKKVQKYRMIDFNDMVWLPVVLDLPVWKYDLLLVDEAQDLNRCQQQLALKAGKRLILCGDPKQAIYGFAGADSKSMERMWKTIKSTPQSAKWLPLTVTRRCGKAIVQLAQRYVEDFTAHETNPEGKIYQSRLSGAKKPLFPIGPDEEGTYLPGHDPAEWSYHNFVKPGDMILCRTNAPLVSECFRFLKEGRKANIQGRNIGQGLVKLIEKFKAKDIEDLLAKLAKWHLRERKREESQDFPREAILIAIDDKRDCIEHFIEECNDLSEVIPKIESIFTDDESDGILLSSGHKAKGLEARNVFILAHIPCPHPMARTEVAIEQEYHLMYVMITRAIETLTFVY